MKEGGRRERNVRKWERNGGRDGEIQGFGEHPTPKTCFSKTNLAPNIYIWGVVSMTGFQIGFKLKP